MKFIKRIICIFLRIYFSVLKVFSIWTSLNKRCFRLKKEIDFNFQLSA